MMCKTWSCGGQAARQPTSNGPAAGETDGAYPTAKHEDGPACRAKRMPSCGVLILIIGLLWLAKAAGWFQAVSQTLFENAR